MPDPGVRRKMRAVAERVPRSVPNPIRFLTLDLRPVFERGGHPLDYHFEHDRHWNGEGHRVAAEALVDVINAQ